MASIPTEYRATLYDLQTKSARQVYLVGEMARSDVGVGGGPIIPPPSGGGNGPRPEHPIVIPEPPPDMTPPADKPPPATGGWGYVADWNAWGYFPADTSAQPKQG